MEETIQVAEPCEQFPAGLYTGDLVKVDGQNAKIPTREEWNQDRDSPWPPDRPTFHRDGLLPYQVTWSKHGFFCWRGHPNRFTFISRKMEENGQLLMF